MMPSIYITGYLLENPAATIRPAIILCPSGSYISHNHEEAESIATQFLANGYQVFVLNYGVGAPYARFPFPQMQLSDTVLFVRKNAEMLHINPQQITVMGLSTAAHLALTQVIHEAKTLNRRDALPNALILGYPLLDFCFLDKTARQHKPELIPTIEMMFAATLGTSIPSAHQFYDYNGFELLRTWIQNVSTKVLDAAQDNLQGTIQGTIQNNEMTNDLRMSFPKLFMWHLEDIFYDEATYTALKATLNQNHLPFVEKKYALGTHGDYRVPNAYHTHKSYYWLEDVLNFLQTDD